MWQRQEALAGSPCSLLRTRGASQIDLIVTDGHEALLAAVTELFSATPRQRCLVHKQRNVLAAIPRRERVEVQAELVGIWDQATKEEALTQLSAFKAKYSKRYPETVRSLAEDPKWVVREGVFFCLSSHTTQALFPGSMAFLGDSFGSLYCLGRFLQLMWTHGASLSVLPACFLRSFP